MSTPSENINLQPSSTNPPSGEPTTKVETPIPPASLITAEVAKTFTPDPAKSAEENATAKTAFDLANPPKVEAPKVEAPVTLVATDIKLPEGLTVDTPVIDKFLGLMNDAKLTPAARAQSLIDLQGEVIKQASEKGREAWEGLQKSWKDAITADKEIGGDKLPPVLTRISQGLTEFGNEETRKAFDLTGAGNNPAIIKFVHSTFSKIDALNAEVTRLTALLSEGQQVQLGKPGATGKTEADIAARMYPTMAK